MTLENYKTRDLHVFAWLEVFLQKLWFVAFRDDYCCANTLDLFITYRHFIDIIVIRGTGGETKTKTMLRNRC